MSLLTIVSISDAGIAPNPANINTSIVLAVTVTETTVEPVDIYYSGEIYSGEG